MGKYQTKKGQILESELAKYMILCRFKSKEELGYHTTLSKNTIYKYLDNPELMPIGNLKEIMSALRIPKDERLQIMEKLLEN